MDSKAGPGRDGCMSAVFRPQTCSDRFLSRYMWAVTLTLCPSSPSCVSHQHLLLQRPLGKCMDAWGLGMGLRVR